MTRLQKIQNMDQADMSHFIENITKLAQADIIFYCKEECPISKDDDWGCRDCIYDWLGEEI